MVFLDLTLDQLFAAMKQLTNPSLSEREVTLTVLDRAQTEAVEFVKQIANYANITRPNYASIDQKFKKDSLAVAAFLKQVIAGALVLELINITATHTYESDVKSTCPIGKQMLDLFKVETLSDIQLEDATTALRCLAQFMVNINKTPNAPTWHTTIDNKKLLQVITFHIQKHPEWITDNQPKQQQWIALNQHLTAVMSTVVDVVNAEKQKQEKEDLGRYLFGSLRAFTFSPMIGNSATFIRDITRYSISREGLTLLSKYPDKTPAKINSFLTNVSKGAMLLELISITTALPLAVNVKSVNLLGKLILEFFGVSHLSAIEKSTVVECLTCLSEFIQSAPTNIRWNQVKTNEQVLASISIELEKNQEWDLISESDYKPAMVGPA